MDQPRKFTRTTENFECEHCGSAVEGDGYTNHCPECLWSKHVDIHPGDRASTCLGLMKPISVESKDGGYILLHSCTKCGFEKRNKVQAIDRFDTVLEIAKSRPLR